MVRNEKNYKTLSNLLHDKLSKIISSTPRGETLPSEPKLAKQLGVSRATLREAMRIFETRGVIHRRQGVGTFVVRPSGGIETGLEVLESLHTLAERSGLPIEMGDFKIEGHLPDENEKEVLRLEEGQKVNEVCWVMEAESRPVAYLVDVVPEDVLSLEYIKREFNGSILDLFLDQEELSLSPSHTEINAVAAQPEVARALGIQRGDVVLYFKATLYSTEGRVVDSSYSYYLPGYFKFHVMRRVG